MLELSAPSFQRPAVFVGRREELDRLADALVRVPVALLCGVGGVGKSALAAAFAATWPGLVVKTEVSGALAELIDDTARLLGGTGGPELAPLDDRVRAVADRLDGAGGLWLIDDLHRLPAGERRLLLRVLSDRLRRGRALATSRERVGMEAGGPDHAEVRVGGLDDDDARELWTVLDQLYGVSEGRDVALARYGGNPFLLRRAHAGALTDDDPVAESIGALEGDARLVAGTLALSEVRLPVSLLAGLAARGRDVLRELSDRLLIDVHADGSVSMHDLVRDGIRKALPATERTALHQLMAERLPGSDLDPARRAREVCRHMRALDRHEEAARYLIERGGELDRYGAAGDLLRGLEAIPHDRRTPEVSMALARVSARLLDLPRALAEHERLLAAGIGPRTDLAAIHALLGLWTGQIDAATISVRQLRGDPTLTGHSRMRARTIEGLMAAFAGAPGEAEEILREEAERTADPALAATLWLYHSFILWLEERDGEAREAISRAAALGAGTTLSYRSSVLVPLMQGAVAGSAGGFAEAEAHFAEASLQMGGDEDLLLTTYVRYQQAALLHERREWTLALEQLGALVDLLRHGGHLLGELVSLTLVGRVLLTMGRRGEGRRTLSEVRARAEQHGYDGVVRLVDRAAMNDPALLFMATPRRPSAQAWSGLFAALRAAAAGDRARAMALVAEHDVDRPGHELGRALVQLVHALIALTGSEGGCAEQHLAAAHAAAAAGSIDRDLLTDLLRAIGTARLVQADGARIVPDPGAELPPGVAVCVDQRTHDLRVGDRTTSLARRPMLRRLLYALVRPPRGLVSKEELARAMWSRPYNAATDPGPLKTNVANLRKLLEPSGVHIEFDDDGYRLTSSERLACLEPLPWSEPG